MAKLKYNDNFPSQAKEYARDGMTDKGIAQKLGIGKTTFYDYLKKYPNFSESIKEGKKPVDVMVENSLLQRAIGYKTKKTKTVELTTPEEIKKAEENNLEVKKVVLRQEVLEYEVIPDVTAQIFWLKNRLPKKWRDRKETTGFDEDAIQMDIKLAEDKLIKALIGALGIEDED